MTADEEYIQIRAGYGRMEEQLTSLKETLNGKEGKDPVLPK